MAKKRDNLIKYFLEKIERGDLKPGDRMPSRNAMVLMFDVSYCTIDKGLKCLIEMGVLSATQGKGTFVSTSKAQTITKIYAVFHSLGYFNKNLEPIFTSEFGDQVKIINIRVWNVELSIEKLMQPGVGVIWYYPFPRWLHLMYSLAKANVPQLLLNRNYEGFNCIMTNAKESLREGLEWLYASGDNRETALVYGPIGSASTPYRAERILAAYELLVEMKIRLLPENILNFSTNNYLEEAHLVTKKLFDRKHCPPKIILLDSELAKIIVSIGLTKGKIPGKDYSMLTFDYDKELAGYSGIGMMEQNLQEFCRQSSLFFKEHQADNGLFRVFIKAKLRTGTEICV